MTEEFPTQAVVVDGLKGAPDGTNQPGEGPQGGADRSGRSDAASSEGKEFQGGQSVMGYHGPQQLGRQKFKDNPNAPAGTD